MQGGGVASEAHCLWCAAGGAPTPGPCGPARHRSPFRLGRAGRGAAGAAAGLPARSGPPGASSAATWQPGGLHGQGAWPAPSAVAHAVPGLPPPLSARPGRGSSAGGGSLPDVPLLSRAWPTPLGVSAPRTCGILRCRGGGGGRWAAEVLATRLRSIVPGAASCGGAQRPRRVGNCRPAARCTGPAGPGASASNPGPPVCRACFIAGLLPPAGLSASFSLKLFSHERQRCDSGDRTLDLTRESPAPPLGPPECGF